MCVQWVKSRHFANWMKLLAIYIEENNKQFIYSIRFVCKQRLTFFYLSCSSVHFPLLRMHSNHSNWIDFCSCQTTSIDGYEIGWKEQIRNLFLDMRADGFTYMQIRFGNWMTARLQLYFIIYTKILERMLWR